MQGFIDRLLRPSLLSCAGALLFALGQLFLLVLYATPQRLAAIDPGYLLAHEFDDYGRVTMEVLRYSLADEPVPALVYAGSSTSRESLDDEDELRRRLSQVAGRPVGVHLWSHSWQTLWETGILLDQLPESFRGVIAISTTPFRLARDGSWLKRLSEHPTLGLYSASFDRELAAAGLPPRRHSGFYLLDHREFFLARRVFFRRLISGPIEHARHWYREAKPWNEREWDAFTHNATQALADLENDMPENLRRLAGLIDRYEGRAGVRVVLVETPRNPRTEALLGERFRFYQSALASFAAGRGVPYWDFSPDLSFVADDFYDWGHLRKIEAQKRFQEAFGDSLAPLMEFPLQAAAGVPASASAALPFAALENAS